MTQEKWRLLIDPPAAGARNMAVDRALMQSVLEGGSPTFRIYGWKPAALSLGFNQDLGVVDQAACAEVGVDVVRRPTGGRAVLHDDEVTYAIVLPPDHPITQQGVVASYKELSAGFVGAFEVLGIESELAQPHRSSSQRLGVGGAAACFDAPSWYELVVAGRKVVGSAQVRRRGALLQHGSIPLHLDGEALYRLLAFDDETVRHRAARAFTHKAAGLAEATGQNFTAQEVTEALITGFTMAFDIALEPGELMAQEEDAVAEMLQEEAV